MEKTLSRIIGVSLFFIPLVAWFVADGRFLDFFASALSVLDFSSKGVLFYVILMIMFVGWMGSLYLYSRHSLTVSTTVIASVMVLSLVALDLFLFTGLNKETWAAIVLGALHGSFILGIKISLVLISIGCLLFLYLYPKYRPKVSLSFAALVGLTFLCFFLFILNPAPESVVGMYFPFISGKNIMFRLLVEIAFVAWIALAYSYPKYRPTVSLPLIAYTIFIAVLFIADIGGIDPERSFFSSFERSEGFIAHVHLFLYFIVLSSFLRTKEDWKRFVVPGFVFSNALITLWGLLQLMGRPEFFTERFPNFAAYFAKHFQIHQSGNRLDSTLGNAAYYGIYTVIATFIWALILTHVHKRWEKLASCIFIVLNVACLYYSGTRGSILGLIAGVIIAASLVAFPWKKFRIEISLAGLGMFLLGVSLVLFPAKALLVFCVLIALFIVMSLRSLLTIRETLQRVSAMVVLFFFGVMAMFVLFRNSEFVAQSAVLSRFTNLSQDSTSDSRLMIWNMSVQGFKENPILGWGQENFMYVFSKYFDPGMYGQEPWFDRSHNVVFDWLIAGGVLGLTSYLFLFVSALYLLWKRGSTTKLIERAILTGVLVAYFVHNLLVFDNIVSYLLFFGIVAYIVTITREEKDRQALPQLFTKEPISYVFYALALLLFFYGVYQPYVSNKALIKAIDIQYVYDYKNKGDLIAGVKDQRNYFETALNGSRTGVQETREQVARFIPQLLTVDIGRAPEEMQKNFRSEVEFLAKRFSEEIVEDESSQTVDARSYQLYGTYFRSLGDYVTSLQFFEKAHALAPKKQRTSFDLITAYLATGKKSEAYTLAKETYLLEPNYTDAGHVLIFSAIETGDMKDALATFASTSVAVPYPPDLALTLTQLTDRTNRKLYSDALIKAYPDKKKEIEAVLAKIR